MLTAANISGKFTCAKLTYVKLLAVHIEWPAAIRKGEQPCWNDWRSSWFGVPVLVLAACVVVLAAVAFVGIGAFAKLQTGGFDDPAAESTAAAELLEQRFGGESDLVFVVRAETGTVDRRPCRRGRCRAF